ncbi:MAG TPA: fused MFS/spermidine synthase [Planctomycetota bacterium]|nr:fused MFS/spermidine synthase [Planctomycetota bacterium]
MARGPFRYPFPLWLLYPAVLLSGFTALVYEVVWARRLALVLGSATSAASAVLSAFMFGLAAGALLVGWRADASRRPLRWYGVLEIGIGVYALAFDSLLDVAGGLLAREPWLCSFVLLSLPAALMGGTLPVLARAASDTTQRGTRAFGSLYGVNTLGAVLGALLAGVVLLEAFGLSGATRFAAVLNIVLGVGFWAIAMLAGDRSVYVADEEAPPAKALGDAEPGILLAFFLAGFAALGLEMAWFRLLVYFLEGFTIAFGLMLAAYLLGLGAGALGGTTLALLAKNPRRLLARILLVEAVLALATLLFVTPLGDALEAMRRHYTEKDAVDSAYAMRLFWTALVVVLPATFCAGMLMPVVARITLADRETIGLHTGVVYAASTFGAVLAPPVVAFLLLPALGVPKTIAALGAVLLLAGTAVAFARGLREWAFAGGAAVVFVVLCLAAGLGTPLVERSHVFRSGKPRRLLHAEAGTVCDVVVVEEVPDATRRLYLDGFSAAETGSHYAYMRMQGHLPVLLHPDPERVLVIAFGTGTTAGAVACHPEVKEIVCVEIEPEVFEAAPFFEKANRKVLADKRVERVVADGRAYVRQDGKFDVITLEPLMPYTPGAVHFYTREFYDLARAALKPGGICCQWIPPQGVSGADFKMLVKSAVAAFPHVSLWYFPHAVLVLGTDAEPRVDPQQLVARVNTADVLEDLRFAAVEDAPHLLAAHVVSGAALRSALEDVAPMTDDRPDLEFRPLARGLGRKSFQCHTEVLEFLRDHHEASPGWIKRVPGTDAAVGAEGEILRLLAREWRARLDEQPSPPSADYDAVLEKDPESLFARVQRDRIRYAEMLHADRAEDAAQLTHAPDRSGAYLALAKSAEGDARRYYLTLAVRQNALFDPGHRRESAELLDELAKQLDGPAKRFCENRARFLRDQPWEEGEEAVPEVPVPDIRPALDSGDEDAARAILDRARQADLGEAVDRAAWEWYEAQPEKRTAFKLLMAIGSAHTLRAAGVLVRSSDEEDLIAVAPYYCGRFPTASTWSSLCQSASAQVREAAAEAAQSRGSRAHLKDLLQLCKDPDSSVRLSAYLAFRTIEPKADETGYDPDQPNEKTLKALADLVEAAQ